MDDPWADPAHPRRATSAWYDGWKTTDEVFKGKVRADRWFDLYQLAEKLVDIDDALAAWRHKHVLTVERIIGLKRGIIDLSSV